MKLWTLAIIMPQDFATLPMIRQVIAETDTYAIAAIRERESFPDNTGIFSISYVDIPTEGALLI